MVSGRIKCGEAFQYRDLMPLMITDWRNRWGYDFPFYMVQLASFTAKQTAPVESTWAELREAQTRTLHLQNTGMAVAIDIGEEFDIHPKNKQEVGRRLALAARRRLMARRFLIPVRYINLIRLKEIKFVSSLIILMVV